MIYNGVAISGKAGAGKSEFGRVLEQRLAHDGLASGHLAFGDFVKEEAFRLFGVKKGDDGAREVLVRHGHGMRDADPDYWVKQLAVAHESLMAYGVTSVVTDVRYRNEYEWSKAAGLLLVRVDTLPMDRMVCLVKRGEQSDFAFSDHPSEVDLDDAEFDYRFWNPHGDQFGTLYHAAAEVSLRLVERAA